MKLVMIIGDSAVGKMTVGQELTKITQLSLFHNHMVIEPVLDIFGYFNTNVIKEWRDIVFKDFLKNNHYGLIFTFMWAFDQKEDHDYVESIYQMFKKNNADIYFVELIASLETRLERNKTENRLLHKTSKKDLLKSEERLLKAHHHHRLISNEGEIKYSNYMRIYNDHLTAEAVAQMIKNRFQL